MSPGAKVNWSHTPSGGYGFSQQVAGVVVRLTAKRGLKQAIAIKDGAIADTYWLDRDGD